MADQTDDLMKDLLQALGDVSEAKQELAQAQSEYTGYSPSYHLHSWHEAEEKAIDRMIVALDAYIDHRIAERSKEAR